MVGGDGVFFRHMYLYGWWCLLPTYVPVWLVVSSSDICTCMVGGGVFFRHMYLYGWWWCLPTYVPVWLVVVSSSDICTCMVGGGVFRHMYLYGWWWCLLPTYVPVWLVVVSSGTCTCMVGGGGGVVVLVFVFQPPARPEITNVAHLDAMLQRSVSQPRRLRTVVSWDGDFLWLLPGLCAVVCAPQNLSAARRSTGVQWSLTQFLLGYSGSASRTNRAPPPPPPYSPLPSRNPHNGPNVV